jgi:hypothetical protein
VEQQYEWASEQRWPTLGDEPHTDELFNHEIEQRMSAEIYTNVFAPAIATDFTHSTHSGTELRKHTRFSAPRLVGKAKMNVHKRTPAARIFTSGWHSLYSCCIQRLGKTCRKWLMYR